MKDIVYINIFFYHFFRSYVALQCEGPRGLHASNCAFRNSKLTFHVDLDKLLQNKLKWFGFYFHHGYILYSEMYLSKMSYSRSPYGDTFDIVDKTSVYEDGSISCMCKVR